MNDIFEGLGKVESQIASNKTSTATPTSLDPTAVSPESREEKGEAEQDEEEEEDEEESEDDEDDDNLHPIRNGYRDVALKMATKDSPFAIFRKFGQLNMLNVLRLQAELMDLQAKFRKCCEEDDKGSYHPWTTNYAYSFVDMKEAAEDMIDGQSERVSPVMKLQYEVLKNIGDKLKEYNAALFQLARLESLEQPHRNNLKCFRFWLDKEQRRSPIFLERGSEPWTWENMEDLEDMIAIQAPPSQRDPFQEQFSYWIISAYHFLRGPYQRFQYWRLHRTNNNGKVEKKKAAKRKAVKTKKDEKMSEGQRKRKELDKEDGLVFYGTAQSFGILISFLAAVFAAMVPAAAILVLYHLQHTVLRIYALMGFTFAFAIAVKYTSSAKAMDIFALTAAFVAVEVVFVGSAIPS